MAYSANMMLWASVSLALVGLPAQVTAEPDELGTEERSTATLVLSGMRDSRERIRSGEFLANGILRRVMPDGKGSFEGDVTYRSIFDFNDGLQRFDCKEPSLVSGASVAESGHGGVGQDEVADRSPVTAFDSKFVRTREWTLKWLAMSPRAVVRLGPDAETDRSCRSVDFRAFGLVSLTDISIGDIDFPAMLDLLMKKTLIGVHDHGDGLFQLTWIEGEGNHVRRAVWFDQHRGYSPVRIEFWDDRHPKKEESIQSGEVLWEEKSGVWLPVTLHLKSSWPIEEELSLTLTWRSVNDQVDRGLFQPEGLGLPQRAELISRELGSPILLGHIDGGELEIRGSAVADAPKGTTRSLRLLLIGLSLVLLIIVGTWFVSRRLRGSTSRQ
jgi:hypothetical protein